MEKLSAMYALLDSLEGDFVKFYDKGNGSAGGRVRKGMQQMKVLAQDVRVNVSAINKEKNAAKQK